MCAVSALSLSFLKEISKFEELEFWEKDSPIVFDMSFSVSALVPSFFIYMSYWLFKSAF